MFSGKCNFCAFINSKCICVLSFSMCKIGAYMACMQTVMVKNASVTRLTEIILSDTDQYG